MSVLEMPSGRVSSKTQRDVVQQLKFSCIAHGVHNEKAQPTDREHQRFPENHSLVRHWVAQAMTFCAKESSCICPAPDLLTTSGAFLEFEASQHMLRDHSISDQPNALQLALNSISQAGGPRLKHPDAASTDCTGQYSLSVLQSDIPRPLTGVTVILRTILILTQLLSIETCQNDLRVNSSHCEQVSLVQRAISMQTQHICKCQARLAIGAEQTKL